MKYILLLLALVLSGAIFSQNPLGLFETATDVGRVLHPGTTLYDAATETYQLSGSGENIWFKKDEFHFAYRKIRGNVLLQTRAKFIGAGTDPHRKIGWMMRTALDTSAAMISATVHGDGLAAIQFRRKAGANIEEVKSPVKNPDFLHLERRGRSFFFSVANFGEPLWTVEVPDFDFPQDLYTGLFICAHHKSVVEQATFDNVRIVVPAKPDYTPYRDYIGSHIELIDVETGHRRIVYTAGNSLQAPNWLPDGKGLIYNSEGLIYRLDFGSQTPVLVNTDPVRQNNNDHVISFDGKMLGLSSSSRNPDKNSRIYTVPLGGGTPTLITPLDPSYLHGWSPDGKWLTYTAQRNGDYNIFKIKSNGKGHEVQLTDAPGLDDGSEYSPDGKWIYYNSTSTGMMQLWRMQVDGKNKQQLTFDNFQNWFPHLSPDGKWIVFISYLPEVPAGDHPFYKHVYLRKMPANGGKSTVLAYLYGGQGTINTPSWSPDGKQVAFVSNSDVNVLNQKLTDAPAPVRPVLSLWENGAPGSESRKNEAEEAKDWWVKNIHNPSLTVFSPPAGQANGAAVVICPGGGHRRLVYNSEGRDAAEYFNSIGVTAFVLKYRLFREENSPYKEADARADGLRAMRLVRSRATEYGLDPNRIGIVGFSAGGELAAWTSFAEETAIASGDKIDQTSARPNFQILIYPGPLAVPGADLKTPPPPAFLVAANDDECCAAPIVTLTEQYRKVGVPVETHLYAQGNHAFNMGKRTPLVSVGSWPQRLTDWMRDGKWLEKK